VIENLAVYRVRFDNGTTASTTAKTDARVVTRETNAAPGPVNAAP
jgi:hypothetical protein